MCHTQLYAIENSVDFDQYPSTVISNEYVKMKVYLPDPENGVYRATRYDWSGMIGSVQYKGHEYFGFWKDAYDPMVGIFGPVDTYKTAGLGYDEAKPGESFIRIGVGFIEKEDEPEYDYHNSYKLVDHGKWTIDTGNDWMTFTHLISSDFGYGYIYTKTLKLKDDGFIIQHKLQNTGVKAIATDQYNHNFFMIDHEKCGPSFEISYPYPVSTEDDLKGFMEVKDNTLHFTKELEKGNVFMGLKGYSEKVKDNKFTIENTKSGTGVTVTVDKPLTKLDFWTNGRVICPENTIQLTVKPGQEEVWTSDYSLFVKEVRQQNRAARAAKRPQYLETGGEKETQRPLQENPLREICFWTCITRRQSVTRNARSLSMPTVGAGRWEKVDADIAPSRDVIIERTVQFFVDHL